MGSYESTIFGGSGEKLVVDFSIKDLDLDSITTEPFTDATCHGRIEENYVSTTHQEVIDFINKALLVDTPLFINHTIGRGFKNGGAIIRSIRILESPEHESMLRNMGGYPHPSKSRGIDFYVYPSKDNISNVSKNVDIFSGYYYTQGKLTCKIRGKSKS